jgi:dihydrofolate synthase/folylpolyglutamate synthase
MRYAQALAYLDGLQGETCKLSLDSIQRVIDRAPFASGGVRYVQVAGTNGKGSVSHYIAAILRSSGRRVGLFTSPHLEDVRERIRVDGQTISRASFARSIGAVADLAARLLAEGAIAGLPTFFETLFLAALHHFACVRADWAVLEVGLGGRLDATTTVRPEVAVITTIALDHGDILGKTLAAIAAEKAGIAKTGVPLVSGCPPRSTAARVIRAAARARQAPLVEAFASPRRLDVRKTSRGFSCCYSREGRAYRFLVSQRGRHQAFNAAVAVAAVDVLGERGLKLGARAVARGIRSMFIPGRLERLPGRPPVILDGAHNPAGVRALAGFVREEGLRGFTLVFGVLGDKSYAGMARLLAPLAGRVVLTEPASPRALPPERLRRFFPAGRCQVERDPARALAVAKKYKTIIIGCGSLYLVGALRAAARGRCGGKTYGR